MNHDLMIVSSTGESQFLALGGGTTKFMVFEFDGLSLTACTVTGAPSSTWRVNHLAWSPDGNYIAVCADDSPYLSIFKRTNNTFAYQAVSQTGLAHGGSVSWSLDGGYACMVDNSLHFFSKSGDTLSKIETETPGGNVTGCSGVSNTTFMTCKTTDDKIVKWGGGGGGFSDSSVYDSPGVSKTPTRVEQSDSGYFACGVVQTPYLNLLSGGSTNHGAASTDPLATVYGMSWTKGATHLACAVYHNTSPLIVYSRSGSTLTKLTDASTMPGRQATDVSFSREDRYLATASTSTSGKALNIYSFDGTTLSHLLDTDDATGVTDVSTVAFSPV